MDSSLEPSLAQLVAEMRAGSAEAEAKFVALYGPHLQRFIRRHLNARLRREVDSDDLVQSVWGAIFAVREKLHTLDKPADVIGYLARAARNRVVDEYRRRVRRQGSRKNRVRPRSLEAVNGRGEFTTKDPTPSRAAAAMELLMRLQEPSSDPQTEVVRRYILGQNFVEIAEQLGRHPDDVRRLFREFVREYRRD